MILVTESRKRDSGCFTGHPGVGANKVVQLNGDLTDFERATNRDIPSGRFWGDEKKETVSWFNLLEVRT